MISLLGYGIFNVLSVYGHLGFWECSCRKCTIDKARLDVGEMFGLQSEFLITPPGGAGNRFVGRVIGPQRTGQILRGQHP